jgi:hypothetical protein
MKTMLVAQEVNSSLENIEVRGKVEHITDNSLPSGLQ